jgi:hypothetical protein
MGRVAMVLEQLHGYLEKIHDEVLPKSPASRRTKKESETSPVCPSFTHLFLPQDGKDVAGRIFEPRDGHTRIAKDPLGVRFYLGVIVLLEPHPALFEFIDCSLDTVNPEIDSAVVIGNATPSLISPI